MKRQLKIALALVMIADCAGCSVGPKYQRPAVNVPASYPAADESGSEVSHEASFANLEWSRKNRLAGRPFIEHQLEIMDFYVGLECATRARTDVQLIHSDELVATFPDQRVAARNPFTLRTTLSHRGVMHEIGLVPDLVFGLTLADGSRRHFMVEIDRATMPVVRSDIFRQTSFEEKMRAYLTAHAAKQHERQFGWKTFRVLTITTDARRGRTMVEALRQLRVPHSPGASLFLFATRDELRSRDPLAHAWQDGNSRGVELV